MDPGDPEASPGAEDGAGGRSAQTAAEGKEGGESLLVGSLKGTFILKRCG